MPRLVNGLTTRRVQTENNPGLYAEFKYSFLLIIILGIYMLPFLVVFLFIPLKIFNFSIGDKRNFSFFE